MVLLVVLLFETYARPTARQLQAQYLLALSESLLDSRAECWRGTRALEETRLGLECCPGSTLRGLGCPQEQNLGRSVAFHLRRDERSFRNCSPLVGAALHQPKPLRLRHTSPRRGCKSSRPALSPEAGPLESLPKSSTVRHARRPHVRTVETFTSPAGELPGRSRTFGSCSTRTLLTEVSPRCASGTKICHDLFCCDLLLGHLSFFHRVHDWSTRAGVKGELLELLSGTTLGQNTTDTRDGGGAISFVAPLTKTLSYVPSASSNT